jgi:multidrug efflux pump subunit AcrA (membrane-fusion protein)
MGSQVDPSSRTPAFIVGRVDSLSAVIGIPERYALDVDPDDAVTVIIDAQPTKPINAKVARIASSISQRAPGMGAGSLDGTLRVEIEIPNPNGRLRPGMQGRAHVVLDAEHEAMTVPTAVLWNSANRSRQTELRLESGERFCFVISDRGADLVKARFGRADHGRIEVIEGLDENDQIITDVVIEGRPMHRWRVWVLPDQHVEIVDGPSPPNPSGRDWIRQMGERFGRLDGDEVVQGAAGGQGMM